MSARPDFSPAMLRLFLRARAVNAAFGLRGPDAATAARLSRAWLRKSAGVTAKVFALAWTGRLNSADARAKLWGALGIVPGDHRVRLTDDGGQADAG